MAMNTVHSDLGRFARCYDREFMDARPSRHSNLPRHLALLALIAAITVAVFHRIFWNGFAGLDDAFYISENHWVMQPISWDSISHLWNDESLELWHPLTPLSFHLIYQAVGLKAWAFHGVSLWFHLCNAILVYVLLVQTTGKLGRSALVSILFSIHPLRVESVAWVAELKDVASVFMGLLCLIAYVHYVHRPSKLAMAGSVLSLTISLLYKPMFVTMPVILLLLDFWPLNRFEGDKGAFGVQFRKLAFEKIPWAVPVLLDTFVVFWLQRVRHAGAAAEIGLSSCPFPLWLRLQNLPLSYVRYLFKGVWFRNLLFHYPMPPFWPAWQVAGATALLIFITVVAWRFRDRLPMAWMGWLWFLVVILPVSGLVQVSNYSLADRYSYFAQIGLLVAVVFAWPSEWPKIGWQRWLGGALIGAVVLVLSIATWNQIGDWSDSEKLVKRELARYPDDPFGLVVLGTYLSNFPQRHPEAHQCFQRALAADPGYGRAYYQSSMLLESTGRLEEAATAAQWLTKNKPLFDMGWAQLGVVHYKRHQYEQAVECYRRALQISPGNLNLRQNLGNIYLAMGRDDLAQQAFADAIRYCDWDPAEPHRNLGMLESKYGHPDLAIKQLERAYQLEPARIQTRINLGIELVRADRCEEGLGHLEWVERVAPGQSVIRFHMGLALERLGRAEEAAARFQGAIQADPQAPEPRIELAKMLAKAGQVKEAVEQLKEVRRIDPDNAQAKKIEKAIGHVGP